MASELPGITATPLAALLWLAAGVFSGSLPRWRPYGVPRGELTTGLLHDVLTLAAGGCAVEQLERWTPLERLLAYDWAMREHLTASDNPVMRRPRPSFLGDA